MIAALSYERTRSFRGPQLRSWLRCNLGNLTLLLFTQGNSSAPHHYLILYTSVHGTVGSVHWCLWHHCLRLELAERSRGLLAHPGDLLLPIMITYQTFWVRHHCRSIDTLSERGKAPYGCRQGKTLGRGWVNHWMTRYNIHTKVNAVLSQGGHAILTSLSNTWVNLTPFHVHHYLRPETQPYCSLATHLAAPQRTTYTNTSAQGASGGWQSNPHHYLTHVIHVHHCLRPDVTPTTSPLGPHLAHGLTHRTAWKLAYHSTYTFNSWILVIKAVLLSLTVLLVQPLNERPTPTLPHKELRGVDKATHIIIWHMSFMCIIVCDPMLLLRLRL